MAGKAKCIMRVDQKLQRGHAILEAVFVPGSSVSTPVDLTKWAGAYIFLTGVWTTANLGFQMSVDNEIFYPLYGISNLLIEITNPVSNTAIVLPEEVCLGHWVRFWSQSVGTNVGQNEIIIKVGVKG